MARRETTAKQFQLFRQELTISLQSETSCAILLNDSIKLCINVGSAVRRVRDGSSRDWRDYLTDWRRSNDIFHSCTGLGMLKHDFPKDNNVFENGCIQGYTA